MTVIRLLVLVSLGILFATRAAAQETPLDQLSDDSIVIEDQDETGPSLDDATTGDVSPVEVTLAPTLIATALPAETAPPAAPTPARDIATAAPTEPAASTPTVALSPTGAPTSAATTTATTTPHATVTPTRSPTPTIRFTTGGIDIGTPIPNLGVPLSPYDGTWAGTTSQGKPISLTIGGSSVKAVNFGWTTAGCGPIDGQTTTSYASNAPQIEGNRFTVMDMSPAGKPGLMVVTGGFSSPTSAGGQVIVTIMGSLDANGAACGSSADISWSATAAGH